MKSAIKLLLKSINSTNPYPITGEGLGLHNETHTELNEMYDMNMNGDDVMISYNHCTDELDPTNTTRDPNNQKEWEEWDKYYEESFDKLHEVMNELGYCQVDEQDGSGGGLYYGAIHFRCD